MNAKRSNPYPETLDEAAKLLIDLLSEGQKQSLKNAKEEDLNEYHFGLGMVIRNNFGLWNKNKTLMESCGHEFIHPDTASSMIIKKAWEELNV